MRIAEACDREQAQTLGSNTSEPNDEAEQVKISVDRRSIFKRTGMALLASGALATLATPSGASAVERNADAITGLWLGVISAQDNSFPPFNAFEIYDGATWTSSGQTDLTPGALSSTLWAVFKRIGPLKFRGIGRFWTYDASANPTGFGTVDQTTTVSEDGKSYYAEAALQFFDNNGNPLGQPIATIDRGSRIA